MTQHVTVRQDGQNWSVVSTTSGEVLASYPTAEAAKRAVLPTAGLTDEERTRRFGDPGHQAKKAVAYERVLVDRLDAGLPLSRSDAREARRIKKALAAG